MNKLCVLFGLSYTIIGTVFFGEQHPVKAQRCNYFAGTAVTGQSINLNLCSISRSSYSSVYFVYSLGSKTIQSRANCQRGTWTTFYDGAVHRPRSQATQNMLNAVCG